ncbi:MAG: hypothetical protein KGI08_10395 [Thaumarchaeota archaeon]|nr:hypothetical protein [Nitrososphaerota archaeon]
MSQEHKWIVNGMTEDNPSGTILPLTVAEGSTLTVQNIDAKCVLGGLWLGNQGPVIIFQTILGQNTKSIIVKRNNMSLKGKTLLLKLNCYRSDWSEYPITVPVTVF